MSGEQAYCSFQIVSQSLFFRHLPVPVVRTSFLRSQENVLGYLRYIMAFLLILQQNSNDNPPALLLVSTYAVIVFRMGLDTA